VSDQRRRTSSGRRRGPWGLLLSILGVALAVRVGLILATRRLPLGSDPTDYDRLARLLAHGRGWGPSLLAAGHGPTAFRPPLYPLFLAGVYRLTGDSTTAARLVEALLGVAGIALLAWIAAHLLGRRVAVIASALAAVYPPLVVYSTAILSEAIFIPLELAAVVAALRARDDQQHATQWTIVAGTLVGLGVLARPSSVVLLLPLAALLGGRASWRRPEAWTRPALLVAAVVVVIAPWLARNEVVMHSVVPVSDIDAFNLAGVYNVDSGNAPYPYRYQFRPPTGVTSMAPLFTDPRLGEVALSDRLRGQALTYLRHNPQAVPEAIFWNTFRMADLGGHDAWRITMTEAGYGHRVADVSLLSWFLLALLAAGGALTSAARHLPLGVVGVPVVLWFVSVPFLGTARLRDPIEPFVILLAAAAIAAALDRRSPRRAPLVL
jgi:4-amino-4-deoxy-L-arabinose transferase-like glycosyltransferase